MPVFEMLVRILDHDHRGIYHRADGDSNSTK
jgi:hypothetical protein